MFEEEAEDYKCELCGTRFELRYYHNKLLCTECRAVEKERESMEEEIWL